MMVLICDVAFVHDHVSTKKTKSEIQNILIRLQDYIIHMLMKDSNHLPSIMIYWWMVYTRWAKSPKKQCIF